MKPVINGTEFEFAQVRVITSRGVRALFVDEVTVNTTTGVGVLFLPSNHRERRMTQALLRELRSTFDLTIGHGADRNTMREQRLVGCRVVPRDSSNVFFTFASLAGNAASAA